MRLGLGTVQFGAPYGATNLVGQVGEPEVGKILALSAESGVSVLDTAPLYGTSEAVLGRTLPTDHGFKIITKTPKFGDSDQAVAYLTDAFSQSLERLRQNRVYGLLAHDAEDLLGRQGETLWRRMTELKTGGQVEKIGVSVYHGEQIDKLLTRFPFDIVQLPINAVDRRLIDGGQLARLAARGVEVHGRSVFLQGLLLTHPAQIEPRFRALKCHVAGLQQTFAEAGLSPLEGALHAVLRLGEISLVNVGVTSTGELADIIVAYQRAIEPQPSLILDRWTLNDAEILDPTRWPELTH